MAVRDIEQKVSAKVQQEGPPHIAGELCPAIVVSFRCCLEVCDTSMSLRVDI